MIDLVKDLFLFMRENKRYWLLPLMLVLILVGGLLFFVEGSVIAPFLYPMF